MANSSQAADRFNLDRFVKAQAEVYARALAELRQGSKRSHWMWFIFPQVNGLGYSSTARFYAITSKEEASAYLNHAVLGKRLLECSEALLAINGKSAEEIFGYPDDLKLRSSMTLFSRVSQPGSVFARVLEQYYASQPDGKTLELLQQAAKS